MTGTDQLIDLVKTQASEGVDLTVLGFGMGNYNDAMLEQISGKGNGNYAFIDTYSKRKRFAGATIGYADHHRQGCKSN